MLFQRDPVMWRNDDEELDCQSTIILCISANVMIMVALSLLAYVRLSSIETQTARLHRDSIPGLYIVGRLSAVSIKQQLSSANEVVATTLEIGATSKEISATSKELVNTMSGVSTVAERSATLAGIGRAGLTRMEETMHHVMAAAV